MWTETNMMKLIGAFCDYLNSQKNFFFMFGLIRYYLSTAESISVQAWQSSCVSVKVTGVSYMVPCLVLTLSRNVICSFFIHFIYLPMKMEPTVSSETSAIRTQTPGNYPKRNKLHLEHGKSLKTRIL